MKQTKHTPEPWYVGACRPEHEGKGLTCTGIRAGIRVGQYRAGVSEPDIRRIVACVNACAGLSTEALEGGALGDLLVFVKQNMSDDYWTEGDLIATLAKLEARDDE